MTIVGISLTTEPPATLVKVTGLNLWELTLNWKHRGDYLRLLIWLLEGWKVWQQGWN